MADDTAPKEKDEKIQIVRSAAGMAEYYSNYASLNWNPYDVRIRFAQVVANQETTGDDAVATVEERAAITLSWAEAKKLRDLLDEVIKRYEKVNGEIKPVQLPI